MSFLAPWFLGLAGLAAVPLLLHFLRRRITQRVDFPAVRYLVTAEREQRRERVLRHRALLLLRLLAVLAIAAALARPLVRWFGAGHAPVAVALVFDTSPSTTWVVDGETRATRLRAAARAALDALGPDDRAWLVTTDGRVIGGPLEAVRRAVDTLSPGGRRGDLDEALRRAAALATAAAPRLPVLALLHDGQRSAIDTLADALPVPVVVLTAPVAPPAQRAVLEAAAQPVRWAPAGEVRFALVAPDSAPWRLLLGGRTVARGTAMPADAGVPVTLSRTLRAPSDGWIAGRVEVDADGPAFDDARWFAVRGAPPPRVRVTGDVGPFVRAAVATLVEEGRLADAAGAADALVAPADLAPSDRRVPRLLLAPVDPLAVADANRALARSGIPWRFGVRRTDTALVQEGGTDAVSAGRPASVRDGAPSGAPVAADADPWRGARVWDRFILEPAPDADATASADVLLTAGGRPWAVAGEGWVLVGSPLVPAAGEVPLRAAFLPWLLDLLATRLGGEGVVLAVAPGDPVVWPVAVDGLARGDVPAVPAAGTTAGAAEPLRPPGTAPAEPGVYVARRGDVEVGALVVNVDPRESDAMPWQEQDLVARWGGTQVELAADEAALARRVVQAPGGLALDLPLVALALLALLAELLLGRGFLAARGATAPAAAPARG